MHLTPIGGGKVLLEPGEGLDPSHADDYLEELAETLIELKGRLLLYDLKSVPLVDALYYDWLCRIHALCSISGVGMVVVNMQPAAAFALAMAMERDPPFRCALDVDSV
ncbi:hypothetical protein [Endothiovibrio diazotrophicus]